MRAINLKTNHLTAPLGMDAGPLFLSWQCVDGVRQTAYEIELTANGETVWHSGKVQSAAVHADAPTVGGSRVRGCWRVRLWDENDTPGAWSEAHFETGLAQSDWQGEWVDPETEEIDIPGDDAVNAACAAVPAVTKGNQQLVFTVTQMLRYIVCLCRKVLVAGKAAGG